MLKRLIQKSQDYHINKAFALILKRKIFSARFKRKQRKQKKSTHSKLKKIAKEFAHLKQLRNGYIDKFALGQISKKIYEDRMKLL